MFEVNSPEKTTSSGKGFLLSRWVFDFYVVVRAFVIGLSQISYFFSKQVTFSNQSLTFPSFISRCYSFYTLVIS